MTSQLQDVERLLRTLSPADKAQVAAWLARELTGAELPGIERTPGVCGGAARIAHTRIPVWLLEEARRLGVTDVELLQDYPSLTAEDLANAWAYVRTHVDEVERAIALNNEEDDIAPGLPDGETAHG